MKSFVYSLLFILFLASCSNITKQEESNSQVTMNDINTLEDELFNESMTIPDADKAQKLVDMYVQYADQNPKDSISPDFLFKAADICMNFRAPVRSISLFNRIINNYPQYPNLATAMFLKGFVYEDQVQDYTSARKSYTDFLEKFPNNEFSDDARVSLQNLGKTPEELIKEFEKNN